MSLVIHLQGRWEVGGGAENNLSSHWGADYILDSSPVHHWATYGDDQPFTRWFIPIVNQPNSQSACFEEKVQRKTNAPWEKNPEPPTREIIIHLQQGWSDFQPKN